jgi:hypothetical protein
MTRNLKSLASQAVLATSAETRNSTRKFSVSNVQNGDGNIDVNMFKVPAVLRTDNEYLAARYSAKLRTTTTNVELSGLTANKNLLSKTGPLLSTGSGYSVGQYSTNLESYDMDFQCKGLSLTTEVVSEAQPVKRTDTESSVYYSTQSRISTESVIKRQPRTRPATDEISEQSKRTTWMV